MNRRGLYVENLRGENAHSIMIWSVTLIRTLVLGTLVSSAIATPSRAGAVIAPRSPKQSIRLSRMDVWGSNSGLCASGGSDHADISSGDSYVCISLRFASWHGYHKGRVTLTSPLGMASSFASFHGTSNRTILHAFRLQALNDVGTWMIDLRLDGRDAARKSFMVVAAPTPTPPSSPSVSVSLASPPPGFIASQNNGVYELTDTTYGAQVDLSRFTLTRDTSHGASGTSYVVNFYVTASKIPSPQDTSSPYWWANSFMFQLVASNQHPYSLDATCTLQPEFEGNDLYNGESTSGWVCSEGIEAQNLDGSYTLTWEGGGDERVPMLNVDLTAPSS